MRRLVVTTIVAAVVISGTLSGLTPARAQTAIHAPSFTLVNVLGGLEVTHDQTFDFGSAPPPKITVQNHNGDGWPACAFSAASDHGSAQQQNVGGSVGYDTNTGYVQPRPIDVFLSVPVVFTLTLNCGSVGTITARVSAELPPPTPTPSLAPAAATPALTPAPVAATHAPIPVPVHTSNPVPVAPIVKPIPPVVKPISTVAPPLIPTPPPSLILPVLVATPIISTILAVATTSPTHISAPTPTSRTTTPHALATTHVASTHFPWAYLLIGALTVVWLIGCLYWMTFRKKTKTT